MITSIAPTLRIELKKYLVELESSVFAEDTTFFDETASKLIDCIRFLLEEGDNHAG